ncbi:DUF1990 family protein [Agrococcus jejuensis]|uniref:Uncharacterized protein, UPF0548 family n=1 Tax=Agrococcus jejuensis TaxID=399736 RepID=A0A1G8C8C0_9MICO|nr:DUF1990 domain-containing protein [Agrococcus jejuensis]SDH41539.1 Uncharacterized protein, UPF0548 family [Agrococcus jejuensis]
MMLDALARTGPAASSTQPASAAWAPPDGWRAIERTAVVGGAEDWSRLRDAVLHWVVKRRSGFAIPPGPATAGERLLVTARVGPVVVREPIEVVEVVDEPTRAGFAYATLAGHPVASEEAFVVHVDGDAVVLTVRALTRAAPSGPWRAAFPALRAVQEVALRRYLRALR